MKINPRYYPAIILVTFVLFVLIGFLLGFRPQHNGGEQSSLLLWSSLT
jgi:hypothetical protein